jgi:hypothetical protein
MILLNGAEIQRGINIGERNKGRNTENEINKQRKEKRKR